MLRNWRRAADAQNIQFNSNALLLPSLLAKIGIWEGRRRKCAAEGKGMRDERVEDGHWGNFPCGAPFTLLWGMLLTQFDHLLIIPVPPSLNFHVNSQSILVIFPFSLG
jgi:hypothetical protein